jgi:hypothetical protein
MALLAVTAPADLLGRLPAEDSVRVGVIRTTAEENEDGTWTVMVLATEDQIPGLVALGHTVVLVETDAAHVARFQELEIADDPPVVA